MAVASRRTPAPPAPNQPFDWGQFPAAGNDNNQVPVEGTNPAEPGRATQPQPGTSFNGLNEQAIASFLQSLGPPSSATLRANFQRMIDMGLIPPNATLEDAADADEIFIPGYGYLDTMVGADTGQPSSWQTMVTNPGGAPTVGGTTPNANVPPGFTIGQLGGQYPLASVSGPGFMQPFATPFQAPNITDDPSYQWRLDQGAQALLRNKAALGTLRTGGAIKDLEAYAQGLASTEYANAFDRARQQYLDAFGIYDSNRRFQSGLLGDIAGMGLNATSGYVNAATNAAYNAANQRANAQRTRGSRWGQTVQDIGNVVAGTAPWWTGGVDPNTGVEPDYTRRAVNRVAGQIGA